MSGHEKDGISEQFKKLPNEEPRHLCKPPSIVWIVKSRNIRWTGHVARMWGQRTDIEC